MPELPNGLSWYEIGGQSLFLMYDAASLSTKRIGWIIKCGAPDKIPQLFDGEALPRDQVLDLGNGWGIADITLSSREEWESPSVLENKAAQRCRELLALGEQNA